MSELAERFTSAELTEWQAAETTTATTPETSTATTTQTSGSGTGWTTATRLGVLAGSAAVLTALTTAARGTKGERPEGAANQTETETDGSDGSESSGAGTETDTTETDTDTQGGETGTEGDEEDTDAGMPTDQGTDTDEGTDAETSEETPDTDTDTHNPPQPVDPATHGETDGKNASTDSDDSDRPDSDSTEGGGETSTVTAGTNTNTDNTDQQDSDQDNTNTAPAPPVDPNAETEGDSGIDQDGGGTAPDNRGIDPDEGGDNAGHEDADSVAPPPPVDQNNTAGSDQNESDGSENEPLTNGVDSTDTDGENSVVGPGPANSPGSVIINGTETEDQVLTATLNDADGLPDGVDIRYQWQRNTGTDSAFENIENATSETYTLGDADVGRNIRVVVNYTDDGGMDESLTSEATAAVRNINDSPSGSVSIEGTAEEDQTLTANVDNVTDADGLGAFSYQWQRSNGSGGFGAIENATGQSYTLGDEDVGSEVRVQVSYTDGNNTAETVTSAPTTAVTNINDSPTGSVTIEGTAAEDETLTANTDTLADDDGLGTLNYQWQSNTGANGAFENIENATSQTYILGDNDVGREVQVIASYTDDGGMDETLTSAPTTAVININDEPTGSVSIDGTVREDERLTADTTALQDEDGLPDDASGYNYQWQRSDGSGGYENIDGATSQSYTLVNEDIGREVRVQVSYTDGNNTDETLNSMPTAEVGTANIAPTGGVRIDGTVRQGQELSADISALRDADGLPDNAEGYRYQWQRTQTDGIFADIGDATEQTYTVEAADLGQRLQVVVRYTDNNGADETLTAATVSPAVTNANDPVIEDDANIVNGTADDDTRLQAAAGSQRINGLAGDDVLIGGAGADILDGGDGKDTAYYFRDSADIEINLETGTGKGGNAEGDVLINIENIVGGNGNDRLTGNNKDNILNGFWGNDRLDGGEGDDDLDGSVGNDTLNGGSGNDRLIGRDDDDILTGGSGNDLFRFRPFDGSDTITDFGTGDDRLQFEFGLFADLEAVRTAATQTDDGNLEITLSETEILTLEGVTLAALTAEAVTTLDREGNDTTTPPADAASDAPAFELDDLAIDEESLMQLAASESMTLPAPEPQAAQSASEPILPADKTLTVADPLGNPVFDPDLDNILV